MKKKNTTLYLLVLIIRIVMVRTKKIMVVDDEPDITITLKKGLEEYKQEQSSVLKLFEVDTFNDPELALSNFKPGFYDILIIDIKLPKINGFELCDKIRQIDDKVKVCFISAFDINYHALREMFPLLDIECFIPKPIIISELIGRINAEVKE